LISTSYLRIRSDNLT